jgi:peptidylprolyl isomerase
MLRVLTITLLLGVALTGCRLKQEEEVTIPAPPDVAAPPADALKTPSGLASKVLSIGFSNVRPGPRSTVTVNYTLWTPDGKMRESTLVSGQPAPFEVDGVIPGWTEGLQLMVVGEKRRFWIPGHLAYGEASETSGDSGDGSPRGMLVFDIELLSVR